MKKYLYIIGGTISLCLGLLGLVTPGLPTTPFILLTGFLYARSSGRLYAKLENNRLTGMYLKGVKNGFSLKTRILILAVMWSMISFTAFILFANSKMQYVMIGLGIIGTISQLIFLRKKDDFS
ncbi:YbaN family protein [Viscerimonas tarda]